jgi:hypothetical protein
MTNPEGCYILMVVRSGVGIGTSIGLESLRGIVLRRFVDCDELKDAIGRALARGMNLVKKCAAKDFCDTAHSDLTWVALLMYMFQLASPLKPIFTLVWHVVQ